MKQNNLRFYNAKLLLLKEGSHTFTIENGELWVEGDRISYVGEAPGQEKVSKISWNREMDVKGNLLMPGFKNAHTHTAMTFLRSYADDVPLQSWLNDQVFPQEAKLRKEDIFWLDVLGIMEYLTSGITSNFDMYFFQPENAKASIACGFRSVFVPGLNNFVDSVEKTEENYLKLNEMDDLVSHILGFHAEYTTSYELLKGLSALAEKYHSPVFFHNAETLREVKECRERYGLTPTQLADELGMYRYGGGGFHCIWMEEEDISIFKKRNLTAVTCPASNLKLASGIAPIRRYTEEKINVAIGTDGPASNNCLDMFREMFLTTGLSKVREMDAESIPADEVLYMATAGGAKAMNLPECDRLSVGKKADLIMLDLCQPDMQPQNNIVKNIVYSGSKQNVKMTMVNGKILYEDQKFYLDFDKNEVYARVNEIIEKMRFENGGLNGYYLL